MRMQTLWDRATSLKFFVAFTSWLSFIKFPDRFEINLQLELSIDSLNFHQVKPYWCSSTPTIRRNRGEMEEDSLWNFTWFVAQISCSFIRNRVSDQWRKILFTTSNHQVNNFHSQSLDIVTYFSSRHETIFSSHFLLSFSTESFAVAF